MKRFYFINLILLTTLLVLNINTIAQGYNVTLPKQYNTSNGGGTEVISFTGTMPNANGNGTLTIYYGEGDFSYAPTEYLTIAGESGPALGNTTVNRGDCNAIFDSNVFTIPMATINAWAATGGKIDISCTSAAGVNNFCSAGGGTGGGNAFAVYGKLSYPTVTGPNDAGATNITPSVICPGTHPITATINNYGTNQITSVNVNWSINGILQTPIAHTSTLDTIGGTGSTSAVISLGSHAFTAGVSDTIAVWTSLPNAVADTTTANDSVVSIIKPSLSGVYTIDAGSPASLTNYQSFTTALNDLSSIGICGPIVFNVVAGSGPYVINRDLSSITGSSAINTVTFNGNGNTINRGSGTYFLALNGVKHFTINNFNFVNENPTSNMYGIMMRGGCDSIIIKNNTINVGTGYTTSLSCGVCASSSKTSPTSSGNNANNVLIDSNTIIGAYYGISLWGTGSTNKSKGHKITNNIMQDQYVFGIYNYYGDSILFHNNDISRPTRTTLSTFYGIESYYSVKCYITNNKIHDGGNGTYTTYAIYFGQSSNSAGNESYVVNNAIYNNRGTSTMYGLYLVSTMSHLKIYHNTIEHNTTGSTSTIRGIYRSSTPNNEEYRNNLVSIYGSGTGSKHCYFSNSSTTFTGGNNLFYMGATGGTNNHPAYFSGNQATIAAWSTASSTTGNSDVNPSIVAGTYTPLSGTADNGGSPLPTVPTDIDGAARSATTPDFGAVEFVGLPGDMSLTNVWLNEVDLCYGTADTAYATIKNDFGTTVDFSVNNLTINWSITGPATSSGTITINSGTLAVGASMDLYVTTVDMSAPGTYTVSGNISANAVNASALNDTLTNHSTFDKKDIIAVDPEFDTLYVLGDSAKISTQSPFFPGGAFFITEICQFRTSNGSPTGGWPSYFTGDDYMEITGIPNSDLAGHTIEFWSGSSLARSYTFPTGTVMGPNGTAIIAHSTTTSSPSNFFYGISPTWSSSSGTRTGRILKDASGNIVDAVVYYNYVFPAAAGVTASDWTGVQPYSGSTCGIKLQGADVNSPTNWVTSSSSRQDPNTLNTGVTVPAPSSVAGIQWTDLTTSTALDTTPSIWVKGFTTNGTYPFEVTFTTPCGAYSDTAYITFLQQTLDTVAPVTVCDTFFTPLGGNVVTTSGYPTDTIFGVNPVYDSIIRYYPLTVNVKTTETIAVSICDSLISPSGKSFKTSGTHLDTIPNAIGCDSIITINLTITTIIYLRDTLTACDSNVWRGRTLTTSGIYYDTIFTGSCDSIYIHNLTVNYASYATFTQFVCDSLVSPSGKIWKTNGTYMDTITNATGCDSNMVFNLTFGYISYITSSVTVCDSFTSPSGKVWMTSGTHLDTIVNASGCDSAMTFNLTVNNSYSRTDNVALCPGQSYRVGPSLYTSAGTYTNVFTTSLGCDSTIITNLSYYAPSTHTINYNFCLGDSVQILGTWYYAATSFTQTITGGSSHGCDSVITHNVTTRTVSPALNLGGDVVACLDGGANVIAPTTYDTYLWSNGGGTTNTLTTTGAVSGISSTDYILTVTQASSACTARDTINITYQSCVGLNEVDADLNVNLYPNPASDFVTIEIFDKNNSGDLKLEILNSIGQVVYTQNVTNANQKVIMDVNNFSKGLYLVRISSERVYMTKKLLIQK